MGTFVKKIKGMDQVVQLWVACEQDLSPRVPSGKREPARRRGGREGLQSGGNHPGREGRVLDRNLGRGVRLTEPNPGPFKTQNLLILLPCLRGSTVISYTVHQSPLSKCA